MKTLLVGSLSVGIVAMCGSFAIASPISFEVIVNTVPLIGHPAGPFYLDFQLNDGSGTLAVTNTVTLSQFGFAGHGNLPGGGPAGPPSYFGGAAGNVSSTVFLTDGFSFFNEFFQAFNPGATLSFVVTLTRNVDPGPTPDAFSFAILNGALENIPTTGLGDSLLLVNINSTSLGLNDVQTFTSTDPLGIDVHVVPEPMSLILIGTGLVPIGRQRRRRLQQVTALSLSNGDSAR